VDQPDRYVITRSEIDRLNPALLRYARRFLSNADAEDVVQATWIGALQGLHAFGGRSSLHTWLRTILRRRICDQLRSGSSRLEAVLELEDEIPTGEAPDLDRHDLLAAAEVASAGLAWLSAAERAAVELIDMADMERASVARQMRVSRGNLRVLLSRARAKLAELLEREGFGVEILAESFPAC
jgi:RNA polymerase sigma-70 factor (ECF subfamily)